MKSFSVLGLPVLLSLLAAGGAVGVRAMSAPAAAATNLPTRKAAMKPTPLTIDLQSRPNLQFRIDSFAASAVASGVSASARRPKAARRAERPPAGEPARRSGPDGEWEPLQLCSWRTSVVTRTSLGM